MTNNYQSYYPYLLPPPPLPSYTIPTTGVSYDTGAAAPSTQAGAAISPTTSAATAQSGQYSTAASGTGNQSQYGVASYNTTPALAALATTTTTTTTPTAAYPSYSQSQYQSSSYPYSSYSGSTSTPSVPAQAPATSADPSQASTYPSYSYGNYSSDPYGQYVNYNQSTSAARSSANPPPAAQYPATTDSTQRSGSYSNYSYGDSSVTSSATTVVSSPYYAGNTSRAYSTTPTDPYGAGTNPSISSTSYSTSGPTYSTAQYGSYSQQPSYQASSSGMYGNASYSGAGGSTGTADPYSAAPPPLQPYGSAPSQPYGPPQPPANYSDPSNQPPYDTQGRQPPNPGPPYEGPPGSGSMGQYGAPSYPRSDYQSGGMDHPQYGSRGNFPGSNYGPPPSHGDSRGHRSRFGSDEHHYDSNPRMDRQQNSSRFNRGPRERDLEGDDRSMGRSTRFTDPAQDSNPANDTIEIFDIPQDTEILDLATMFSTIGVIKKDRRNNNDLIRIHESGEKALITYDDPFTAKSAIEWFDGKELNGVPIRVGLYEKRAPRMSDRGRRDDRGGRGGGGGDRMFGRGGGGFSRGGPGGRGGRDGGGMQGRGEGDWSCPSCGNLNFARRRECNRCQNPKPEGENSDLDFGPRMGGPPRGMDSHRGDFNRGGDGPPRSPKGRGGGGGGGFRGRGMPRGRGGFVPRGSGGDRGQPRGSGPQRFKPY